MSSIRPYRSGDEVELSAVCLQTADSGADGTGLLDDDELWAQLFVLPYLAHDPELAFVVETDDGRVAGTACTPSRVPTTSPPSPSTSGSASRSSRARAG
jgi:hypothetical protein